MFANCQLGGMDTSCPDTCLTPSASAVMPITYPNMAQGSMAAPAHYKVLLQGGPAHNMTSIVCSSNGDEAGVATGVCSGTMMGPSTKLTAAFTTFIGVAPATRMTSVTIQNSTNMVGMAASPSQTKVLILSA